jgi:hypothetical protein
MLKEVEDEIKMTKYRVEVKKDIKKIINNDSNDVQKLTSDDTEFEAFYEANS